MGIVSRRSREADSIQRPQLAATALSGSAIRLQAEPSKDAAVDKYVFDRLAANGWLEFAVVPAEEIHKPIDIDGLTGGTAYEFRVCSVRGEKSSQKRLASATTLSAFLISETKKTCPGSTIHLVICASGGEPNYQFQIEDGIDTIASGESWSGRTSTIQISLHSVGNKKLSMRVRDSKDGEIISQPLIISVDPQTQNGALKFTDLGFLHRNK